MRELLLKLGLSHKPVTSPSLHWLERTFFFPNCQNIEGHKYFFFQIRLLPFFKLILGFDEFSQLAKLLDTSFQPVTVRGV